jgi:hypothetical protein
VPQGFNRTGASLDVPSPAAVETSVRQLIANGKSKTALDRAKDLHKAHGTATTEALLLDAYAARIQALMQQGMAVEAKSLIDLVQERYPSSRARLEALSLSAAARTGTLEELVEPLNDPQLSAELRAAVDRAIQNDVHDLAALAACAALPPEHPLRKEASALHEAFIAVTTGPVAEDTVALPEVSHRSPLASWKLMVRAIGCFYRSRDELCSQYLDAIKPESAAGRLAPAMRAMIDGKAPAALTPASAALVSEAGANVAVLQSALQELDRAFAADDHGRILKGIKTAVEECRRSSPSRLERLKQHIMVRCSLAGIAKAKATSALGGLPSQDAYASRLLARGTEQTGDPEDQLEACAMWEDFRHRAVKEGWFAPNGAEVAALYLHMASLLGKVPNELLAELQESMNSRRGTAPIQYLYFIFPNQLYQRACALDPHFEAFSKWLEWARKTQDRGAESVAESWHKIRPMDLDPVLFLMEEATRRNAFHTALQYLGKAEGIDGVHPSVRRARLRLLVASALQYIQKKKPDRAEEKVAEMAALPESQQGDRPAVLAAVRCLASAARGDMFRTAAAHLEVERLLESRIAAELFVFVEAASIKRLDLARLRPLGDLRATEKEALPAAVARVVDLVHDVQGILLKMPAAHLDETTRQVSRNGGALSVEQLRTLAETGVSFGAGELAYTASASGLERGGATEATFLLLRARSLPNSRGRRRAVCAAAALELARQRQDMQLVEKAVQALHHFAPPDFSITLDQAADVLRKEKAARVFDAPDPDYDYDDLFGDRWCDCPDCRRARGEIVEDYDDEESDPIFDESEIPAGPSFEEVLTYFMNRGGAPKKHKKGRRR